MATRRTLPRWIGRGVLRRIRGADRPDDRGAAIVIVVGSMMILTMLALTGLAYSISSTRFSRYSQDYAAAMAAAQSGVDDFISRLDRDPSYGMTVDCDNEAWRGPVTATNTCGWAEGTATGWLPVQPGADVDDEAAFHYSVDASRKVTQGSVLLTVTGRMNGVYRTIETTVGMGGSTDYVYYTDFESADPSNTQAYSPNGATKTACGSGGYSNAKYWYDGRSSADCKEITFIANDYLDGAVFSNDAVLSSGATFAKGFETALPSCANAGSSTNSWNQNCLRSGSTANFNGTKPVYAQPKYLVDNSAAFATNPGCHYFGATRVIFNSNGTMTVWNKKSVNGLQAPVSIAPEDGTAPNCGTLDALDSTAGATLAVPTEMVIYAANSGTANRQCYAGEIGGPDESRRLPLGTYAAEHSVDPSVAGTSYTFDTNMTEPGKFCGQGNLYAEGVLDGRLTISAQQSVIVTGDLILAGGQSGDDLLGLVATNSVEVFHPRVATVTSERYCTGTDRRGNCNGYAVRWRAPTGESDVTGWPYRYTTTPAKGVMITGSIQTLQHSFLVQKYDKGANAGTLQVYGSIAQRWRGIVGQGSGGSMTGYAKLYQYDSRLQYTRPPYFPTWANSEWTLRYSGEIDTPKDVRD